jgi:FPC/CPF motif-containing protein YcgG
MSSQFAQQITGMRFCEASAKDNFNVDEIFLKLVDDILKKVKEIPYINQFLFCFGGTGVFEVRASHLLGRCST